MLILDDNAKAILDDHGVPYGEYTGPDDIFLSFILNVAMETAIKYNDGDPTDPETLSKYVQFLRNGTVINKCINKLDKASHDMLNIVCNETDGKHKEIMEAKYEEQEAPTE